MAESKDPIAKGAPKASADEAVAQDKGGWPQPGQEGFVHPDGTPQAAAQLEDNKRAAVDRAKAGSIVHGAPLGTPGPTPEEETAKAVARAEKAGGIQSADSPDEFVTLPPPEERGGRKPVQS